MKPTIRLSYLNDLKKILRKGRINTVCEESRCPNISECFSSGTATFMILGDRCTRACSFCNVRRFKGGDVDPEEPKRIAETVHRLGLRYVVITSVTRDDLCLGGAFQFYSTVVEIKSLNRNIRVEVLVPDFGGSRDAIEMVMEAKPDVFSHNVETIPRLYRSVRKGADYERSLKILKYAKSISDNVITKSGLIVGFGESIKELEEVMEDLISAGCDILTIGQYYSPSLRHYPVKKFYSPEEFKLLKDLAYSKGFKLVFSGSNVRSSYMAHMAEVLL